jgi:hypothetical protein
MNNQPFDARETMADDINNAPSAGESDEPSYTKPSGFPVCSQCGHSTRNMNQLVCAPCRNRTRLILTADDRRWLQEIGISAR